MTAEQYRILHTTSMVLSSWSTFAGIGVDDTFIMVAAWRRTDHRLTVEDRMGQTFSDAAVAVTITTLTDVLSISVGALAPFRSVQIFCAYTVAGLVFDFFYQVM